MNEETRPRRDRSGGIAPKAQSNGGGGTIGTRSRNGRRSAVDPRCGRAQGSPSARDPVHSVGLECAPTEHRCEFPEIPSCVAPIPLSAETDRAELERAFQALADAGHVRVFVPSRDRVGAKINHRGLRNSVARVLAAVGGGATTLCGVGHWYNDSNALATERVAPVEAYFRRSLALSDCVRLLVCLAHVAQDGGQAAVGLAIDGKYFELSGALLSGFVEWESSR